MSPVYLDRLSGHWKARTASVAGPIGIHRCCECVTSEVPGGMWAGTVTLGALGLFGQTAWGKATTTTMNDGNDN